MTQGSENTFGLGGGEVRRRHIVLKALLVGLLAGLLASAFRISLTHAENFRQHLLLSHPGLSGLGLSLGISALGGGLCVWLVRRFAPHANGSGIPQLHAILRREAEPEWKRLLPVKFIAGVVGIGGGLALGREGPTVQMGGGVGHMVSSWFKVKIGEGERRALISAGAGAGLAAAFNAPLSGLIFVLEELHGNFTPVMFVAAFLASVTGNVVSRLLVGEMPVFTLTGVAAPGVASLPWALLLGALAGGLGILFNRSLLAALDLRDRIPRCPPFLLGTAAGLLVGIAAWAQPGLAGSGGVLVQKAFAGGVASGVLPLLLCVRFILTVTSYGSGAAGGIFGPLLVLGAFAGLWFGSGVQALLPVAGLTPGVFCVLGMGAMFTGVVRAPLTGIVLMIELTGVYEFMLPLLASCLAAYGVAEALGNTPIYEALRERALARLPKPMVTPDGSAPTPG